MLEGSERVRLTPARSNSNARGTLDAESRLMEHKGGGEQQQTNYKYKGQYLHIREILLLEASVKE